MALINKISEHAGGDFLQNNTEFGSGLVPLHKCGYTNRSFASRSE